MRYLLSFLAVLGLAFVMNTADARVYVSGGVYFGGGPVSIGVGYGRPYYRYYPRYYYPRYYHRYNRYPVRYYKPRRYYRSIHHRHGPRGRVHRHRR